MPLALIGFINAVGMADFVTMEFIPWQITTRMKIDAYFLLSAHYLKGKDEKRDKMEKKYKRKLSEIL